MQEPNHFERLIDLVLQRNGERMLMREKEVARPRDLKMPKLRPDRLQFPDGSEVTVAPRIVSREAQVASRLESRMAVTGQSQSCVTFSNSS